MSTGDQGAYVIKGQMDPAYDPPSVSLNPRASIGSTPVSEEPARPTGSTEEPSPELLAAATEFVKRRYSYDPAAYISKAARLAHLAGDAYSTTQDPAFVEPWQAGISEGRRQATEGWEREWGAQYRNDSWVQATFDDQASATEFAAGAIGHRAVSRLVGPWEPAEQPEPDWAARKQALDPAEFRRESLGQRPRAGYQCAFGGADCPGHSSKWLMCDPAAGGESRRPRMTDGCGPEHTYRGACAYAGEASGG